MATAARKTNWFAIWVSVAVVVVIAAIAIVTIWMSVNQSINSAPEPSQAPQSSNIDTTTGAISFGDGSNTVDTYIDFMCPYCNQFEQSEGSTLTQLLDAGTITLNVHPIAILDNSSQGTEFSSRAASAMYAVSIADPDNALAFLQAMYANQPSEGTSGLTNAQIISIAEDAGVTMTDDLKKAINVGRYVDYVQTQSLPDGATGTPTVVVNGELVNITFDPQTDIVAHLK